MVQKSMLPCCLLATAAIYVRGESGMCHAAAALGVTQVTIWGGCMDWTVLGGYPGQHAVGVSLPACGRYQPCTHCDAAMRAITPDWVAEKLRAALSTIRVE